MKTGDLNTLLKALMSLQKTVVANFFAAMNMQYPNTHLLEGVRAQGVACRLLLHPSSIRTKPSVTD
jgi:hypothetical protein